MGNVIRISNTQNPYYLVEDTAATIFIVLKVGHERNDTGLQIINKYSNSVLNSKTFRLICCFGVENTDLPTNFIVQRRLSANNLTHIVHVLRTMPDTKATANA